ncbi:unnamed protein product [Linum trigynum]|uniref:Uncharacterized protein n=1 Tax=Linum trigynum TaxID=586398 RepID=A0AAV2EQK6_9ROSI
MLSRSVTMESFLSPPPSPLTASSTLSTSPPPRPAKSAPSFATFPPLCSRPTPSAAGAIPDILLPGHRLLIIGGCCSPLILRNGTVVDQSVLSVDGVRVLDPDLYVGVDRRRSRTRRDSRWIGRR